MKRSASFSVDDRLTKRLCEAQSPDTSEGEPTLHGAEYSISNSSRHNDESQLSATIPLGAPGPPTPNAVLLQSSTIAGGKVTLNLNTTNHHCQHRFNPLELRERIAAWLSTKNYHAVQKDTYEKVIRGTGEWLIRDPVFENWMRNISGILWGTGIPGAGKTCLISGIIQFLQSTQCSLPKPAPVIYVYCHYKDQLSTTEILASLLRQLLEEDENVAGDVAELYNICQSKGTTYTHSEILNTLKQVLLKFSSVFIAIDGLDELRDTVRCETFKTLKSFQKHLFLTSRDTYLGDEIRPNFDIRPPSSDFQLFIHHKLQKFPMISSLLDKNPDVSVEIAWEIEKKADGMFLLATLQLEALKGVTTIRSLRKAVNQLPSTLTDIYHLTLTRIDNQSEEMISLAYKAIYWVLHATRILHINELLTALSIDPSSPKIDPEAVTTEETVISVCHGLLAIEKENKTVHLVHFTAEDFFSSYATPILQHLHAQIASVCASYLYLLRYNLSHVHWKCNLSFLANSGPLLDYAYWNIGVHLSRLAPKERIPNIILDYLHTTPSFLLQTDPSIWRPLDRGNVSHFGAFYNIPALVDLSLEGLEQTSEFGMTTLHIAARQGHYPIVQLLLSCDDIDVNAADREGITALYRACEEGHYHVVQLLLNCSAVDVNAADEEGMTVLHLASIQGHSDIVQLLLEQPDINVNALDDAGWNALHFACCHGHKETVQLLLDVPGIEIAARLGLSGAYRSGSTPLDVAIWEQNHEIIALFEERGYHG